MRRGWQLVVEDPSWLSGPAVAGAIRDVADSIGARFVVVDEIEGRGKGRLQLVSPNLLTLSVERAAELAENMLQFEWGDFFFFPSENETEEIRAEDSCPARVSKCLAVMRCVDNTYLYVYGTDLGIREALQKRLNASESKEGLLSELDYPR